MDAAATSTVIPPVKPRRGRKRKQTIDAPCADCLQRASVSNTKGEVSLCASCARALGRATKPLVKPVAKPSIVSKQRRGITKPDYHRQAAANLLKATKTTKTSSSTASTLSPPPLPPSSLKYDTRSAKDRLIQLPPIFESLEEAYDALLPVHGDLATLVMSIESAVQTVATPLSQDNYRQRALRWLKAWDAAFAQCLSGCLEHFSTDERKAALTLKAHHLIARCFASAQPSEAQLDWSVFGFEFEAILNLATEVMRDVVFPAHLVHRKSIDSFQSALPRITILDPVYEVRIRAANVALIDRATQLQATIQTTQLIASPEQVFHDRQVCLEGGPTLAAFTAPRFEQSILPR